MNLNASLHSVLDVVHSHIKSESKVLHTILMFDEIAAEKRIRWDPNTNFFLGVCRQHASRTSQEFINEGDMEELFRCLDDGVVHYAAEVRMFYFRYLLPHRVLIGLYLGHCCRIGNFMQGQPHLPWMTCPCIWGLQARNGGRTRWCNSDSSRRCEQSSGNHKTSSCLQCL